MKNATTIEAATKNARALGEVPSAEAVRAAWIHYDCAVGSGASTAKVRELHVTAKLLTAARMAAK